MMLMSKSEDRMVRAHSGRLRQLPVTEDRGRLLAQQLIPVQKQGFQIIEPQRWLVVNETETSIVDDFDVFAGRSRHGTIELKLVHAQNPFNKMPKTKTAVLANSNTAVL